MIMWLKCYRKSNFWNNFHSRNIFENNSSVMEKRKLENIWSWMMSMPNLSEEQTASNVSTTGMSTLEYILKSSIDCGRITNCCNCQKVVCDTNETTFYMASIHIINKSILERVNSLCRQVGLKFYFMFLNLGIVQLKDLLYLYYNRADIIKRFAEGN